MIGALSRQCRQMEGPAPVQHVHKSGTGAEGRKRPVLKYYVPSIILTRSDASTCRTGAEPHATSRRAGHLGRVFFYCLIPQPLLRGCCRLWLEARVFGRALFLCG